MAQQDVVDLPRLLLLVVSGAFVTVATIIGVEALYLAFNQREIERKNVEPPREVTALREHQKTALHTIDYVHQSVDTLDKTHYTIPIGRAMEKVLKELRAGR